MYMKCVTCHYNIMHLPVSGARSTYPVKETTMICRQFIITIFRKHVK